MHRRRRPLPLRDAPPDMARETVDWCTPASLASSACVMHRDFRKRSITLPRPSMMHYYATMELQVSPLPEVFCWTRFGTEAGQTIERIVARKEQERRSNNGVFFWGIGNSVSRGIEALTKDSAQPDVLFSPIRSRPRTVDVTPPSLVVWRAAETLDGGTFELPRSVLVLSRGSSDEAARPHYALVCSLGVPLAIGGFGRLRLAALRNLVSGRPIGASQVTAVVRLGTGDAGPEYAVAMRAKLVAPFFVRLRDPIVVRSAPTQPLSSGAVDWLLPPADAAGLRAPEESEALGCDRGLPARG